MVLLPDSSEVGHRFFRDSDLDPIMGNLSIAVAKLEQALLSISASDNPSINVYRDKAAQAHAIAQSLKNDLEHVLQ